MTLWELIAATQDRYVSAYRQVLAQQRPRMPELVSELIMRTEVPHEVPIDFRVFRVDFLWKEQGQSRAGAFTLGQIPALPEPLRTEYPGGQVVTVLSLPWEDCPMRVWPALANDGPLVDWLRRWRDRPDAPQPDADGIFSAVHSLTPPQWDAESTRFAADFGSAPAEAVTNLFATLFRAGVRRIEIGSSSRPAPAAQSTEPSGSAAGPSPG